MHWRESKGREHGGSAGVVARPRPGGGRLLGLVSAAAAASLCLASTRGAALAAPALEAAAPARPVKIVLIAGPITGHPKDTHEYEKSVILLKHLLDTSPELSGARIEAHLGGWPGDPAALDDASTIVMISDGGDRRESDHPLYVGDRFGVLERQMARGAGLVEIHWTTFHPSRDHDKVTEWVGGYFDYENGAGGRAWYSEIRHADWSVELPTPEHPVARGIKPFRVKEEYYYRIRFREGDDRLRPLLAVARSAPDLPADVLGRTVAWAVERKDGGRGFGCTGGHYFANWWVDDFRRLILNAIAWTAGIEVPAGGIVAHVDARLRALIVTGHNHPAHDWRATTAALVHVLEQDPRLAVDVSEDVEVLAAESIRGFDVLVLNYNNWDRPGLSAAAREGLERFLASGGGLAVIHFANGAFNRTLPRADSDWPEFRERIVPRVWMHGPDASSHDSFARFRVLPAPSGHPIVRGLAAFDTDDELYFRQHGEMPALVLATARSQVTGKDEPLAWAREHGKGRVFQTVLGHADTSLRMAAALVRRGTMWAAGRGQISFDPPGSHTAGALFRDGSPWTPELSRAKAPPDAPAPVKTTDGDQSRAILPPSPGLDGGAAGHWGVKDEDDWVDGRWSRTDLGPFLCTTLDTPSGQVLKAIVLRVGAHGEGAVCFDTQGLCVRAGWTGGFLELSPKRFGLIERPRIAGHVSLVGPVGPALGAASGRYLGLEVGRDRVVLRYEIGGVDVRDSPWLESGPGLAVHTREIEVGGGAASLELRLVEAKAGEGRVRHHGPAQLAVVEGADGVTAAALLAGAEPGGLELRVVDQARIVLTCQPRASPRRLKLLFWTGKAEDLGRFEALAGSVRGAAPREELLVEGRRWDHDLTVSGRVSQRHDAYVIDTIPVPFDNPYRALFFLSGLDFFANGDAAVSTAHGDVWVVRGIDAGLERVTWKRFATGLFQPLGLKIRDGRAHVLGRDQITVLDDRNGDGEADWYGNFNNDSATSPGGHDFHTCLETDGAGSFYYASPLGVHRISSDGARHETIASGWRNPNGLSVGPGGEITVAPQEGEWTPASQICEVRPGGYYGYPGPRPSPERPLGYDPPLCWIPRHVDNSSGGQVWVTSDRWGPLQGQLLGLSFGRSSLYLVLRDSVSGQPQGAVVPLRGRFESGALRGRFSPADGQLYVVGLNGWSTNAVVDGCFQRVRYRGGDIRVPVRLEVHTNGLLLGFAAPVDVDAAADLGSYDIAAWNYRYLSAYGSKEYSVVLPEREGHDRLRVTRAAILDGGKGLFLAVPGLRPAMQIHLHAALEAKDGTDMVFDAYATAHGLHPAVAREVDAAAEAAGLESPPPPPGAPGLVLTLSDAAGRTDARVSRLAALDVATGEPASPFLEPGVFTALWEGDLNLSARSHVEFSAVGRGRMRLEIDGRAVLEAEGDDLSLRRSERVVLKRGQRRFRLEYASPSHGEACLQVLWRGKDFAAEAMPPGVFTHGMEPSTVRDGARRRRGRELFAALRCASCHAPPGGAAAAAAILAADIDGAPPSFAGIGGRLRSAWLAAWVSGDRSARPAGDPVRCPPPGAAQLEGAGAVWADDIAAYLATLWSVEPIEDDGGTADPERGGALFRRVGCVACHAAAGGEAAADLTPLSHVARKWRTGALRQYLTDPWVHAPSGSMPALSLSAEEAGDLAAHLRTGFHAGGEDSGDSPARGDAARGRELIAALGCAACHGGSSVTSRLAAPALEALAAAGWPPVGCLGGPAAGGASPRFALSASDAASLGDFASGGLEPLARFSAAEAVAALMRRFRCTACHDRDGEPSRLSRVSSADAPVDSSIAAVSSGPPDLTFAGEQLRAQWLEDFLAGRRHAAVRPWLGVRMPVYPRSAASLARGLAAEHGLPTAAGRDAGSPSENTAEASPAILDAGRRLLGAEGGFSCLSCHPLAGRPPEMQLPFAAVDLVAARQRLHRGFFLRWMANPQRVNPRTPMPAFVDADGDSILRTVLDGDGGRQFAAIWAYLGSLRYAPGGSTVRVGAGPELHPQATPPGSR